MHRHRVESMTWKNTMQYPVLIATSVLLLSACSHELPNETNIDPNATNIRIHNASDYDFQNVSINPFNNLTSYGNINRGATTEYKPFDRAYHYAYVRLLIAGETFMIQPTDYVGEAPLGPGKFTYVLDVLNFDGRRSLVITTEAVD